MAKWAVAVAALFWAISGVVAQQLFASTTIQAPALTTIRMTLSGILFLLIFFVTSSKQRKLASRTRRFYLLEMPLFGVLGIFGMQYTYFQAIQQGSAVVATVLQNSAPVLLLFWAIWRTKSWPNLTDVLATTGAVIGVVLLVTGGDVTKFLVSPIAIFWGILSAFAAAFYILFPLSLLRRFPAPYLLGVGMLYGSMFSYWITPATDWSIFFHSQVLPMLLYIVVGGTVIPFFLFLYALRTLPPTTVSVLTCLEPFGAVVFSVLFLGMSFGWGEIIGVICVMSAVLLLTFSKEPREPTQSSD